MKKQTVLLVAACGLILIGLSFVLVPQVRSFAWSGYTRLRGRQSVQGVLESVGPSARARLGAPRPVGPLTLVAFKRERRLDVYTHEASGAPRLLKSYPVLAASGGPGPKTLRGDNQVPEGIYDVESLNPNSAFHLALRLNYPSPEDIAAAQSEGRDPKDLGGDIMIHGKAASIGCLAMGDEAIEELFVLAADAGIDHIKVLIVPHDLRTEPATDSRPWVAERYRRLTELLPAR